MFAIGDFSFDVTAHEQVKADGGIRERFTVGLYFQGKPLSWHPNQKGADDFPGSPHLQVIEWVGRESVAVYNDSGKLTGTKRGADFRTRFWTTLMHLAEKALIAQQSGKTKAEVTDAEMQKQAFVAPIDLAAKSRDAEGKVTEERSLEEAVAKLTKADAGETSNDRL